MLYPLVLVLRLALLFRLLVRRLGGGRVLLVLRLRLLLLLLCLCCGSMLRALVRCAFSCFVSWVVMVCLLTVLRTVGVGVLMMALEFMSFPLSMFCR